MHDGTFVRDSHEERRHTRYVHSQTRSKMLRRGLFDYVRPEPEIEEIGGRYLVVLGRGESIASGSGFFDGTLYTYGQVENPQGVEQVGEIGAGEEMWFKPPFLSFQPARKIVYDVKPGEEGLLFLAPNECGYDGLDRLSRQFLQRDENADLKARMARGEAWSVFISQEREG